MNTSGKRPGMAKNLIATLGGLVFAMTWVIYLTENETYHHNMSLPVAFAIAVVLGLIVAPFAYRYFRDSAR